MGNSKETFHAGICFSLREQFFFSLSLSQAGQPHSPLSLSFFPLHLSHLTKMLHSSNPLWIFKCYWVVPIVVSAASREHRKKLPELDSRGLSFLDAPLPLAQPCSLTAQDLFVFSHGLMSQTQVSLIINDPRVVGPLRLLRSLTWLSDLATVCGCFLSFSRR